MTLPIKQHGTTGFEATDAEMGLITPCEHCDEREGQPVINPYDSRDVTYICDDCAGDAYDRQQERLMETGGGPSLIEQQRAAYNIKHGVRS